jgi:hypothetical protein
MAFPKSPQSGKRAGIRWRWPMRRRPIPARTSDDDLLVRIRERALSSRAAPGVPESIAFEPASAELIEEAEKSLNFALPPLLKRMLLEIGNGGFGPGRGILGVRGGATDEHGSSLVDLYDGLSATNPEEPGWRWPEQLVPICTWGDATYSCVDCSRPGGHVVIYDANGYRPGADLAHFLVPQDLTLDAWLRAWAEGEDLWSRMFPLD